MDENERKVELQKEWYVKNRDRVLADKRQKYQQNKETISLKRKMDRVVCPLCPNLTFKRVYLPHHLSKRHKLEYCQKS